MYDLFILILLFWGLCEALCSFILESHPQIKLLLVLLIALVHNIQSKNQIVLYFSSNCDKDNKTGNCD